jgi:wyosine [tRNA(Phe)-imidazoG37] synthetase (radical SAM superfamily)
MPVFLFQDVIFGPVRSRRLGLSLGINLLPTHSKYCSFNCIYCECGWTKQRPGDTVDLPSRTLVREFLEQKLKELSSEEWLPDALTFAGNGEPTLHPDFPGIVEDTLMLRDAYAPKAKVAVLSNASMLHDPAIFNALRQVDQNIQKLDAGSGDLFRLINNPVNPERFGEMIGDLKRFNGHVIIQSLFLKGIFNNQPVDNTNEEDLGEWLKHISFINPGQVMVYSIARATPSNQLEKITPDGLEKIAGRVNDLGINAVVY